MENIWTEIVSFAKNCFTNFSTRLKLIVDDIKNFVKINPIYGLLFFLGVKYTLSKTWSFLKDIKKTISTNNLSSFKTKYQGDWAFVADVSKTFGATCATLLAKNGYNIISLNQPQPQISEEIKDAGKQLEVVKVFPFCRSFETEDLEKIQAAITEKTLGVIVMNLYYDLSCHFEYEIPLSLIGNMNACMVKSYIFLNALITHVKKQSGKVALMTTGSIVGGAGWPGLQISSGCANFIETLTENIKAKNIDVMHLKSGYVPNVLQQSSYFVEKSIEAERGLMKIGTCEKAFAKYRTKVQNMFHNSKYGKANRFAYAKVGLLCSYAKY